MYETISPAVIQRLAKAFEYMNPGLYTNTLGVPVQTTLLRTINIILQDVAPRSREERLAIMSHIVGRTLTSTKDLTHGEARAFLEYAEYRYDPETKEHRVERDFLTWLNSIKEALSATK